jgi:hypothetical protein
MKDVKGVFRNLEKMLQQASWFEDGWEIYNRGNYLQLYKENWFNHNQSKNSFQYACTLRKIAHLNLNLFAS